MFRVACFVGLACGSMGCAVANPRAHGGPADTSALDGGGGDDAFGLAHDAFMPGNDAFVLGHDAFMPGNDAFVPGNDAFVAPVDAHVPGTGAYLDRCTVAANCASGLCALDRGGTHFCTRACANDLECAQEHVCVTTSSGGVCLPNDTGAPCSVGTPQQCTLGLCLGSAAGGHCTRNCSSAAECPAGYACTRTGGSAQKICVDIEEPCARAADCATGYCVGNATMSVGCTAACDSAADCPQRLPGLPAYACNTSLSTTPLCIPPSDIVGGDGIGALCPATGTNACRSGACDSSATPPMCVQACMAQGGCGPGLGCFPLANGTTISLVCERAGTRDLTQSCARGSDCRSGLCDATRAVCTRLCADGLCPTGYACQPIAGFGIALCR